MDPSYPHYKLHEDPLSMVLCQVQFSRVRKMAEFLPEIQDRLRRQGFSEDASTNLQKVRLEPGKPPEIITAKHDEFRTKDGTWGISIGEDVLAVMTTQYNRFSGFAEKLNLALKTVDDVAEISCGSITRIGLRYIDVVAPRPGETFRDYLRTGLHGPDSRIFKTNPPLVGLEYISQTDIGVMVIRVTQNELNMVVPPGLVITPMPYKQAFEIGRRITLIDTDHYMEGQWDFSAKALIDTVDALHKGINTVWFEQIITDHALKVWGAEHAVDGE